MVKRVVLVFSDGDFLEVPVPEVPVMYHIPGKFLQKASAAFSAVLSGFCTTFTAQPSQTKLWTGVGLLGMGINLCVPLTW